MTPFVLPEMMKRDIRRIAKRRAKESALDSGEGWMVGWREEDPILKRRAIKAPIKSGEYLLFNNGTKIVYLPVKKILGFSKLLQNWGDK